MVSGASLAPGRDAPVVDGLMQREQRRFLQSGTGAGARGRRAGFLIARFRFDDPAFSRAIGRRAERTGNGCAQLFSAGAGAPLHRETKRSDGANECSLIIMSYAPQSGSALAREEPRAGARLD